MASSSTNALLDAHMDGKYLFLSAFTLVIYDYLTTIDQLEEIRCCPPYGGRTQGGPLTLYHTCQGLVKAVRNNCCGQNMISMILLSLRCMFSSHPQVSVSNLNEEYDYVVIVLVVERGGLSNGLISRIPLLSSHFASDGSHSKVWKSVPQPYVGGRKFELVGGNSVGGSSKINAVLCTRGLPAG
ncbi:hypothetical protein BJ138DRAFT_1103672 [Hygrophoropsis aurantiaca]|uniref:Uncharacterized protein n=1 Tax=Hygrophoropsis aurantiaca TaxID=72124 RepID=A0ACB8A6F6_9AGAM|nr:hypothetical protein BJ138DRAFT_1103672 [Hygrophoropsis aurantiaca]